MEELLKSEEIYLQDIVHSVVANNLNLDDVALYNLIIEMTDIHSFDNVEKILELIRLNKRILTT